MTYYARIVSTAICLIGLQIVSSARAPAAKTKKAAGKKVAGEVDRNLPKGFTGESPRAVAMLAVARTVLNKKQKAEPR